MWLHFPDRSHDRAQIGQVFAPGGNSSGVIYLK
jgi:hypothetical protein